MKIQNVHQFRSASFGGLGLIHVWKFVAGIILLSALVGRGDVVVTNSVTLGGSGGYNYTTLKAACDAIAQRADWSVVNILVKADVQESNQVNIPADKTIRILCDSDQKRVAIEFSSQTTFNGSRCIDVPAGARLEVGGEDSEGSIVLRACSNSSAGRRAYSTAAKPLIVVHGENAELKLGLYGELAYGDDVVFVADRARFTMTGGVIHSGYNCQVLVARDGEFTLEGGYIMGHYVSVPSDASCIGNPYNFDDNPIMNIANVENAVYGGNAESLPTSGQAVSNYLKTLKFKNESGNDVLYYDAMNNSATSVMLMDNGASFRMRGGNICGCIAGAGTNGSITRSWVHDLNPDDGTIVGGIVTRLCIAVAVDCANFEMTGGNIYGNERSKGTGGAVLVCNSRDDASQFQDDGIYDNATFTMTGGRIFCNEGLFSNAGGAGGGAIRLEGKATLTMTGGMIDHNCTVGGGAIRMVSSKLVIDADAEISHNYAAANTEASAGGGIAVVCQNSDFGLVASDVRLLGGRICGNKTNSYGGGISLTDKGNKTKRGINVTFGDVLVSNNVAQIGGGGIYCGGTTSSRVSGGATIVDNEAVTGNGGGILVDQKSATSDSGTVTSIWCRVIGNRAKKNGGGIAVVNGNFVSESDQTGTSLISGNYAEHVGGGLYATGGTGGQNKVEFLGGEISLNSAADGGGIYVTNGVLAASGGSIVRNSATRGGGMCLSVNSSATFSGTVDISHNVATNIGGAVAMNANSTLTINNGTFMDNEAQMGGGVHLVKGANMTYNGGMMSGNRAVVRAETATQTTAWHTGIDDIYPGVGGAVYVGAGESSSKRTQFSCPGTSGLVSIFENTAEKAGNDIVVSGLNTALDLPDAEISNDIYRLSWYEDYYTGDTKYGSPNGTRQTGSIQVKRYADAFRDNEQIAVDTAAAQTPDTYWCLTLGYEFHGVPPALWITDHADAGMRYVHLQLQPDFRGGLPVSLAYWAQQMQKENRIYADWISPDGTRTNSVQATLRTGFEACADDRIWITAPIPASVSGEQMIHCKGRIVRMSR